MLILYILRCFHPGSTGWLVGWQLLLQWRNLKRQPWVRWWILVPLFITSQYTAWVLVQHWMSYPKVVIWTAFAAWITVVTGACFSRTIQTILRFLSQPNLLKLFFLAPISTRELGRMSVLNIVLYSMMYMGIFYAPLAFALIAYGHAGGFAFFIWLPALAMLSTLLGLSFVMGLLKLWGARRARRAFQVLGTAVSVILLSFVVLPVLRPHVWQPIWDTIQNSVVSEVWWSQPGWIQWMSRLALGHVPSLVTLTLLAVLLLRWTESYWGTRFFGFQHSLLEDMKSSRQSALTHFELGRLGVLCRKEWRTLWRDPRINSEVLIDAAQVLPLVVVGMYNTKHLELIPLLCLGWVALGSLIASRLCWLSMSIESGAAWYIMGPECRLDIRDSKWVFIVMPFVGLTLVFGAVVWIYGTLNLARSFTLIAIASILLSSRIQIWMSAPLSSMQAFYQRLPRSPLAELISILFIYGTTFMYVLTLAWSFKGTWWGLVPLGVLVAIAYIFRLPLHRASHVR